VCRFKGKQATQLGFVAQEVAEKVLCLGAQHFNLVKQDASGQLCLNVVPLLALVLGAAKGAIQGLKEK
jgi:hypothetical protein